MTENTQTPLQHPHYPMIIQSIVIIAFLLIIISLGSALYHLVKYKSQENSEKTAKALTVRISLSVILFIFVFIMIATGLYKPHGIGTRMHLKKTGQMEGAESGLSRPTSPR
jgi:heme/copper-type cytochrome/quinol oxidase subunit 2